MIGAANYVGDAHVDIVDDDAELVAGLEELRSAGARVGYEVIDITDPVSLAAAVRRIEDRLGPVTAVGHGVSPDHPVPVHEITSTEGKARNPKSETARAPGRKHEIRGRFEFS